MHLQYTLNREPNPMIAGVRVVIYFETQFEAFQSSSIFNKFIVVN